MIKMDCNACKSKIKGKFHVVGIWSGAVGEQPAGRVYQGELNNVHLCEACAISAAKQVGADFEGVATKLKEEQESKESALKAQIEQSRKAAEDKEINRTGIAAEAAADGV